MTRILVIFGTTDGHTRKIAHRLGESFRRQRVKVDVVEAGTSDVTPDEFNAVVVCASVHAGGYQRAVAQWVNGHVDALHRKPTAFVSVCLGILQRDPKVEEELSAIIDRFLTTTGWQPTMVKKVAGALLYRQYGLLKRWMMKRIVAAAGGDTDTSRDYEYTDWEDLRAFAKAFVAATAVARRPAAAAV
jgi:menaquinone-dependent protoporphyrinogen oxidase